MRISYCSLRVLFLSLAQIFSAAVTYIEGKAYVGGQNVDNKNARFVDFLLSGGAGSEAILVEIKTPMKPLLRKKAYRNGIYPVSLDVAIGRASGRERGCT